MSSWDTAGNIINDAAVELGLLSFNGKVADPFGSSDANLGQLCQLLKSLGRDLLKAHEWTTFLTTYTFVTVQGTSQYPLPDDYGRLINQAGWNRTNRLPLGGPLSSQEWQYLKGQLAGVVYTVLYRLQGGQIQLYPDTDTPGGYTIAFEYVSKNWVQPNGQAAPTTDVPTAASDTLWFDPQLLTKGLKLKWLEAKKFDTTAEEQDFEEALRQAKLEDTPAPVLRMGGGSALQPRFIDASNIPITGFGTGS